MLTDNDYLISMINVFNYVKVYVDVILTVNFLNFLRKVAKLLVTSEVQQN